MTPICWMMLVALIAGVMLGLMIPRARRIVVIDGNCPDCLNELGLTDAAEKAAERQSLNARHQAARES